MTDNSAGALAGADFMVVEDNLLISLEIEQTLTGLGGRVLSCSSVPEGLLAIGQRQFDLMLTDYFLDGADCLPLIEAAAAQDIPYALLTGYSIPDDHHLLANAKIISKPFKQQDIIDYALSIVETARANGENSSKMMIAPNAGDERLNDVEPC